MVARPKDDDGSSSLDAIREAVPPSPRFGERGSGGEGRIVSKTQDVVATPTLSAPHPQPFSPDDRGEGGKIRFVCVD